MGSCDGLGGGGAGSRRSALAAARAPSPVVSCDPPVGRRTGLLGRSSSCSAAMMVVARHSRPSTRVRAIQIVLSGPTSACGLCDPISSYGTMTALTMMASAARRGRTQSLRAATSLASRRSTSARSSASSEAGRVASQSRWRSLRCRCADRTRKCRRRPVTRSVAPVMVAITARAYDRPRKETTVITNAVAVIVLSPAPRGARSSCSSRFRARPVISVRPLP